MINTRIMSNNKITTISKTIPLLLVLLLPERKTYCWCCYSGFFHMHCIRNACIVCGPREKRTTEKDHSHGVVRSTSSRNTFRQNWWIEQLFVKTVVFLKQAPFPAPTPLLDELDDEPPVVPPPLVPPPPVPPPPVPPPGMTAAPVRIKTSTNTPGTVRPVRLLYFMYIVTKRTSSGWVRLNVFTRVALICWEKYS